MIFAAALLLLSATQNEGDCLAYVTTNLAKGNGNWYSYYTFANKAVTVKTDDTLVYTIYLDKANPEAKGGVDAEFTDGGDALRDLGAVDQEGVRAHGDGILNQALGHWYTRHIPLKAATGRTTADWQVVEEADRDGKFVQYVKDVYVLHGDGSKTVVYGGGKPSKRELSVHAGYTQYPVLVVVDSNLVTQDASKAAAFVDKLGAQVAKVAKIEQDLAFARKFLEQNPDPELAEHLQEAEQMLSKMQGEVVSDEYIEEVLHTAQHALSHAHPEMQKYTGHLVGHAHIDLQWLWEWQEGMVSAYDTFNQATKFMDEFPGFTFSQSSSCLYQTIQENWPELFKKMQAKVKAGQWEIVGGRVCEGDTNMISPESHIRHFLYGQSYFRENFGKTARVGWEPDTFGHTLQMPQILKLGGCDSYYFCRGGKGKPLFWWEGLDGTRILSFDEPATGSWYNSDLSYKQFQEMLDFQKATGSKDSLMVYGIGNHGGGPSREYIETALEWMKDKTKPKVKFSTATQFFDALRKYDLTKIPVVDQELNPVFDGCYTSQADVKELNRKAEYATTSAEAVATVASAFGFNYPRAAFRKNWEDITFNHHHDTLPGSGIHAPYERTKTVLGRVLADDKDIVTRALETLSVRVTPAKGGLSVMVFNPSGWTRSGMVRTYLVKSGWDGGEGLNPSNCMATDASGSSAPVSEIDPESHLGEFEARNIPPFGWKVFQIKNGGLRITGPDPRLIMAMMGEEQPVLINDRMQVDFDKQSGTIKSLSVKDQGGGPNIMQGISLGLPEIHTEHDDGMSAWVLGKITKVEPCKLVEPDRPKLVVDRINSGEKTIYDPGGDFALKFSYEVPWTGRKTGQSTVEQTFHLEGDKIIVDVDCDWHALGTPGDSAPLLRVAFDTGLQNAKATYEVPFGALSRPVDGKEYPALNWADASDGKTGIAVLNDSKSGYSCSGSTLRLSLIRSSTGPDPAPNQGHYHWRYAIVPHKGDWRTASLPRMGYEFQQPLLSATVPFDAHGSAPLQWSMLNATDPNVLVTGIKRGEKSDDLIVHLFDAGGQGSKGVLTFTPAVAKVDSVNFLEDVLAPLKVTQRSANLDLHKFEIKCLKAKLAAP
ncbi:MAG: alpha-mannosidase [Armatimonadetes bacterium]|nr:alpha-mannosidase [Armatimonadota bacterium]